MKNGLKLNSASDPRYVKGAGKYQKEQYQKRLEDYKLKSKYCLSCNKILDYQQVKNNGKYTKFCSRSCSATFNNKQRIKNKN